jgi:hypothetical protein
MERFFLRLSPRKLHWRVPPGLARVLRGSVVPKQRSTLLLRFGFVSYRSTQLDCR